MGDFLQCLPHHLAHSLSLNIRMWGNQELTIGVADAKNGVSLGKGLLRICQPHSYLAVPSDSEWIKGHCLACLELWSSFH